jgi:hypothetical protein
MYQTGCEAKFRSRLRVEAHYSEVHNDPAYACVLCTFKTRSLEALDYHTFQHQKAVLDRQAAPPEEGGDETVSAVDSIMVESQWKGEFGGAGRSW